MTWLWLLAALLTFLLVVTIGYIVNHWPSRSHRAWDRYYDRHFGGF